MIFDDEGDLTPDFSWREWMAWGLTFCIIFFYIFAVCLWL